MSPSPEAVLWMVVALGCLFAMVIFVSLKARRASLAKNLEIRAQDLFPWLGSSAADFENLLYGMWQDKSAKQMELVVRDCRDQQVSNVAFRAVSRTPCLSFQVSGTVFEADALSTLRESVALHPATDSAQTLCIFRELPIGVFQFEVPGIGSVESRVPRGIQLAPIYDFTLAGSVIGRGQHIGGWRNRGICIILPATVPLPVRIFILAMQRLRA